MGNGDASPHASGDAPRDPEEREAAAAPTRAEISPLVPLGAVHLTVSELKQSLVYSRQVIGLDVLEQGAGRAGLGTGGALLVLVEEAGARPGRRYTGLYHFAMLVQHRRDLSRWLAYAARDRVEVVGLADRLVSEAVYLSEPDRHGIEIYWDRPREVWDGQVALRMTTPPLEVWSILDELPDPAKELFDGLPPDTVMGHVHLKVTAILDSVAFYRDLLGFGVMAQLGPYAAFFGAGGYHHHFAANTWESVGAPPPPPRTAALRHATIVFPEAVERERVLDHLEQAGHTPSDDDAPQVSNPSGNTLVLAVP